MTTPGPQHHGSAHTGIGRSPATTLIHQVPPAPSFTSAGPSQLTTRPPRVSSCCKISPPDSRETTCHGSAGANRNTHARTATAIASNPSAAPPPAGSTGPSSGSRTTAHRVKCTRISSARRTNRRSQPRTVIGQTPNRAAIRRNPSPAIFASTSRTDHRDLILTTRERQIRQQHMRTRAPPAPRPPRPQQPIPSPTAQHPHPREPPRSQHRPTRRTPEQPANQLSLHQRHLGAYDQHRGATSGIQEGPPDDDQADGRALARSQTREASHHHHQQREPPRSSSNSAALNTRLAVGKALTPNRDPRGAPATAGASGAGPDQPRRPSQSRIYRLS